MKKDRRPVIKTLSRGLALRCPACGESTIVKSPFQIKDECTSCGVHFKREEGFFVGAIMANVVTTELVILVIYIILLPVLGVDFQLALVILFTIALLFPVAFYHHSWSFWLSLDHLIESLQRPPGNQS